MRKGGFGGGKKRKATGGGNAHHQAGLASHNVKHNGKPLKVDVPARPGLLQRLSSGFLGPHHRVPKVLEPTLPQQQHPQQHSQPHAQPSNQAHRLSQDVSHLHRAEPAKPNNLANPQPGRQDLNRLAPPGTHFDNGQGWNGERPGQHGERPRRHSAEPMRTPQHWPQNNHQTQQHGNALLSPSQKYHPDYQHHGNVAQKPIMNNQQQNHHQNGNGLPKPAKQRPARKPTKATYKVVAPLVEKGGNLVQQATVPDFVKEGATAAGTALVEEVFTKSGQYLGRNFIGWWAGEEDSSKDDDAKKADQANGNALKPTPPVANQQPTTQQPVVQQLTVQQPVFQQPVPQQPVVQQPVPLQPIIQQQTPVAPPQWQVPTAADQTYVAQPTNSCTNNTNDPSPSHGGSKSPHQRPNVGTGDELIFPSHYSLYPHTIVSWYDGSSKWQDDYLFFNAWNTTTSRSVLAFVAKKYVTMGFEHIDAHFKNVYPHLWWRDSKQDAGNQVMVDKQWQWGQLGDGGERFVVYHEHVFPGLYNTSFTSSIWQTSTGSASPLTKFDGSWREVTL